MKKALLTLAALTVATTAFGQGANGTITFFNNNLTGPNGVYRAGIFRDNDPANIADVKGDSTIGAGAGFTVGLFLAGSTTPLATTTFRTTTAQEVFIATVPDVQVTGVAPGQTANLVVRAWETSAGSYEASTHRGEQAFTSRPLGGPNPDPTQPAFTPPDLGPGFTGFEMNVIPEPSTIALGALGIGALLLRRRK